MGAPVNILVFWFRDDWGRYGRSYEKIASSLAGLPEVDQVVCVFPPEIVDDADAVAVALHERRLSPKLALLTERIRAHDSLLVGRAFRSIRRWRGRRRLGDYLRGRGFTSRNTILWMFPPHPYIDRIRRQVPHRLVVTHFIDNFKHFDTSHSLYRFAMKQYLQIGRWSDVIFTNSEPNRVEFSTAGVPCHRFAQGVDEAFIARPSDLPDRATDTRPRLGYLGWIMERMDLDLLAAVAAWRPDWDLVLVGPEYPGGYVRASGLLRLANVRWLGELPNREAPAFLQSLDVCRDSAGGFRTAWTTIPSRRAPRESTRSGPKRGTAGRGRCWRPRSRLSVGDDDHLRYRCGIRRGAQRARNSAMLHRVQYDPAGATAKGTAAQGRSTSR